MMKYKTMIVCAGIITAVWLLRCILAGSFQYYGFIIWNVFLATIPLLLEIPFRKISHSLQGLRAKAGKLFLSAVWLLFIPNAFYILTDFMHLNSSVLVNQRDDAQHFGIEYFRGDGIYVLDSLLLLLATVYGAYVGGLALLRAYTFFKRHISVMQAKAALGFIMFLSAIGVYIGRFGRWNSWDGLIQPWNIAGDLISSLASSQIRERFLAVAITIVLLQLISVWCVHLAGREVEIRK